MIDDSFSSKGHRAEPGGWKLQGGRFQIKIRKTLPLSKAPFVDFLIKQRAFWELLKPDRLLLCESHMRRTDPGQEVRVCILVAVEDLGKELCEAVSISAHFRKMGIESLGEQSHRLGCGVT